MPSVNFFRVKEQSQRVIWVLVTGLMCYWTACFLMATQFFYLWIHPLLEEGTSRWLPLDAALVVTFFSIVFAAIHYSWATRSVVKRTLRSFCAQELDRSDPHHVLFRNTVKEICVASGHRIRVRCVIIPSASMNGFSMRDPQGNAIVGVTEGMLARLKRNVLQAVVAQLTGQVLSKDALLSTVIFSLFSSLEDRADEAVQGLSSGLFQRADVVSPVIVLGMLAAKPFLRVGQFFNLALSRERIFRADALGVELTRDPVGLAQALRQLSYTWRGCGMFGGRSEAVLFVPPGRGRHDAEIGLFRFLFRSQPPLKDRLNRVLSMAGTSLASIDSLLRRPAAPRAVAIDAAPAVAVAWKVHQDGAWQGPFTEATLFGFPWFGPAAYVCRLGTHDIMAAKDDAVLKKSFLEQEEKHGRCPRCRATLSDLQYEGVRLRACAACAGKLVPGDAIHRILIRQIVPVKPEMAERARTWMEVYMTTQHTYRVDDDPLRIPCPACAKPMTRKFYSPHYLIEIDTCDDCAVIWFDAEELELLEALVEQASEEVLDGRTV